MNRHPRRRLIPLWGVATALTLLAACSRTPNAEPAAPINAGDINAYLQAKAERLFPDQPGITVADVRLSEDRTVACGLLEVPGRAPVLFTSYDTTPATLERSMAAPYLSADTPRQHEIEANRLALDLKVCRRNGLMPEGG